MWLFALALANLPRAITQINCSTSLLNKEILNNTIVQGAQERFVNLAKLDPGKKEKLFKSRKKFVPNRYKPFLGPL